MKRPGITGKLVFSSACILLTLGVAVTWYSLSQIRSMLYQEAVRGIEALTLSWIEANITRIIVAGNAQILDPLLARDGIAYAVLFDADGKEIVSRGTPAILARTRPAYGLVAARGSTIHEMEDSQGTRYFELEAPIVVSGTSETMLGTQAGTRLGTVRVGVMQGELERRVQSLVRRSMWLYIVLVVFALGISVFFAQRMAKPIVSMGRVATQIARDDLSGRVEHGVNLRDEVGELVRNFNEMTSRLAANREEMNLLYSGLEEKVKDRTLELEQANHRLQELDELKTKFLSTVSHELRTPLTSIKAFAQILLDSPNPDPATRKRFLGIIDTESDRLSRLISDLLDLARIESGAVNWRLTDTDLGQVVAGAAAPITAVAASKGIRCELVECKPEVVHADADRIQQVLTNLLSNALKFSNEGGRIRVWMARSATSGPYNDTTGDYVRVAVEDSGPGVHDEDRHRIFERFYQSERGGARGGTGLGLAISREIVLHHQGEIWVESKPGEGSTFYFTLPLQKSSATVEYQRNESKAWGA